MSEIMEATIKFTKAEADQLMGVIDQAVRSGGIRMCGPALLLSDKISRAFEPGRLPVEPPKKPKNETFSRKVIGGGEKQSKKEFKRG